MTDRFEYYHTNSSSIELLQQHGSSTPSPLCSSLSPTAAKESASTADATTAFGMLFSPTTSTTTEEEEEAIATLTVTSSDDQSEEPSENRQSTSSTTTSTTTTASFTAENNNGDGGILSQHITRYVQDYQLQRSVDESHRQQHLQTLLRWKLPTLMLMGTIVVMSFIVVFNNNHIKQEQQQQLSSNGGEFQGDNLSSIAVNDSDHRSSRSSIATIFIISLMGGILATVVFGDCSVTAKRWQQQRRRRPSPSEKCCHLVGNLLPIFVTGCSTTWIAIVMIQICQNVLSPTDNNNESINNHKTATETIASISFMILLIGLSTILPGFVIFSVTKICVQEFTRCCVCVCDRHQLEEDGWHPSMNIHKLDDRGNGRIPLLHEPLLPSYTITTS